VPRALEAIVVAIAAVTAACSTHQVSLPGGTALITAAQERVIIETKPDARGDDSAAYRASGDHQPPRRIAPGI